MILEHVQIKNFRGIGYLEVNIPTDRPLIVTGDNGKGKSSLLGGIEWCLTGNIPTDQKVQRSLLKSGSKKGHVTLKIADWGAVRRDIDPHKLTVPGLKKPGITEAQYEICTWLKARKKDLELCLRPDLFIAERDKDQRAKLFEVLQIRITEDVVQQYLKDNGLLMAYCREIGAEMEQQERETDDQYLSRMLGEVTDDLDSSHAIFFEARRVAKKDLKNFQRDKETHLTQDEPIKPAPVEALTPEQAFALQDRIEHLARRIGRAQGDAKARDRRHDEIRRLKEELKDAFTDEERTKAEQIFNDCKAKLAESEKALEGLTPINKIQGSIRDVEAATCFNCGQPYPDQESRAKRKAELEKELEQARAVHEQASELRKRVWKGEAWFRTADAQQAKRKQLAELLSDEQEEPIENIGELEAELEEAKKELGSYQEYRDAATAWERYHERTKALTAEIETLVSRVAELERLVDLFGDNGIKFRIFSEACKDIAAAVNSVLNPWGIVLRFGQVLEMEINRGEGWRELAGSSAGEKLLVALGLQVWLSDLTGLKFVCLDRIEELDRPNQAILFKELENLLKANRINHAICCGVRVDRFPAEDSHCEILELDFDL